MSLIYRVLKRPVNLEDLINEVSRKGQGPIDLVWSRGRSHFDWVEPAGRFVIQLRARAGGRDVKITEEEIASIRHEGALRLSMLLAEESIARATVEAGQRIEARGIPVSVHGFNLKFGVPFPQFLQEHQAGVERR